MHLPSELSVQHLVLKSSLLTQALNVFYATVHFPAMIAFLIWMFVRHRDRYPQVRNTVVIVTGAALAIQLIPVAPPRLTPGLGFVDTRALFHQSVYASRRHARPGSALGDALGARRVVDAGRARRDRCSARADGGGGSSRIPRSTVLAVVATGNHWWFDGDRRGAAHRRRDRRRAIAARGVRPTARERPRALYAPVDVRRRDTSRAPTS